MIEQNRTAKFNIGDEVICVDGFTIGLSDPEIKGAGEGYRPGRTFKIAAITLPSTNVAVTEKGHIYWAESGSGVFEIALKLNTIDIPNNAEEIITNINQLINNL